MDDKHDAVTLALEEIMKGLMNQKEAREEWKRQEKEEQMNTYIEIQKKKLEIKENIQKKKVEIEASIAKTKANEVKLVWILKEVEIMTVDSSNVSPRKGAWFKKKQKEMPEIDE